MVQLMISVFMVIVTSLRLGPVSSQSTACCPVPWSCWDAPGYEKVTVTQPACPKEKAAEKVKTAADYFDEDFVTHGNSSYFFGILTLTWDMANKAFAQMGAHLVTVDTYKEDMFLTKNILEIFKQFPDIKGFYIGAKRRSRGSSSWIWTTNRQPLDYTRWGSTEPADDANADCVLYWKDHPLFWSWGDIWCGYRASFICEKNLTPGVKLPE